MNNKNIISAINQNGRGRQKMAKAIASLTVLTLIIVLGVCVMMKGWGLRPQSWWWIIGGGVFGHYILYVIAEGINKGR